MLRNSLQKLKATRRQVHIDEYRTLRENRAETVSELGIEAHKKKLREIIYPSKVAMTLEDFCEFPEIRNTFHLMF